MAEQKTCLLKAAHYNTMHANKKQSSLTLASASWLNSSVDSAALLVLFVNRTLDRVEDGTSVEN